MTEESCPAIVELGDSAASFRTACGAPSSVKTCPFAERVVEGFCASGRVGVPTPENET